MARLDGITARAPRKDTWLARRGAILERAERPEEARAAYRAALDSLTSQSARIQQTRASVWGGCVVTHLPDLPHQSYLPGLVADVAKL